MALIPVYHVVADMFHVDPDWATDSGKIEQGQCVALASTGYIETVRTGGDPCIGLAADAVESSGPNSAFAKNLIIGANGASSGSTQNRVSDNFNETMASGKLTVYRGGGRFLTDQYESVAWTVGGKLYASGNGKITSAVGNGFVIGFCAAAPAMYPSGVPGTDIDGSITLGTFIDILLTV